MDRVQIFQKLHFFVCVKFKSCHYLWYDDSYIHCGVCGKNYAIVADFKIHNNMLDGEHVTLGCLKMITLSYILQAHYLSSN